MGGTAGLMGAGESILGASIGSGVAAGASTGLGHSDAANIASGIIGGVTGRTVGRVLQNRRIRNQNVQPTGNRLGGSRGGRETSRLIADIQDPNIPRPNVPAPGEPTQTRNPFIRLKRSIAKRIKDTTDKIKSIKEQITKPIKDTTDKIKSIKQQISKPYTYKPFETDTEIQPIGTSTTDYNKQQFPPVPQLHEPIQRNQITLPEDLEFKYFQQEQKQLQRKYLEELKGGHTNPDISQLRDLTDSGAHWESNPLSRSKKVILAKNNEPDSRMMDNIKQIVREENEKRKWQ